MQYVPNLNEFFKKEEVMASELEKFGGKKPCAKCDKDAEEFFWEVATLTMTWTCPDGHHNSYRLN
jgi:hypothetical protein